MELNFLQFRDAVLHPEKRLEAYIASGRKVVGCFPPYVPESLIHASGMVPFGMWGAELEVAQAKKYFPAYICGILQTNIELAMRGVYDGISAVIIPTLCDSLKCATQNWKYAVPDIEMIAVNYPQNRQSRGASEFLYCQFQKIQEELERISGNQIKESDLEKSIDIYNTHNSVMREFLDLSSFYPSEISPQNRNYVIKSGYFMDKNEHTEMVRNLIKDIKCIEPKRFRGIRVITTGIVADSPDLMRIFEENKVSVAMDDIAHESRQFRTDIPYDPEDIMGCLVQQFLDLFACSTLIGGNITREDHILQLVEKYHADGVIIILTKFCDPEEYDYPVIKKKLEEHHIPMLTLEIDKQMSNYGQAATAIQSFQEMIRL